MIFAMRKSTNSYQLLTNNLRELKMAESILRIKSKQFAIDIVHACREMRKNKVEYALIDQLLRSGTIIDRIICVFNNRERN